MLIAQANKDTKVLILEETSEGTKITFNESLDAEKFRELLQIVKSLNGTYTSAGKSSFCLIPKIED